MNPSRRAVHSAEELATTELRVSGGWSGWSGKTIVRLTDGTLWKQQEYVYEYRYDYRPRAIVRDGRMQVEGMSRAVRVNRIDGAIESTMDGGWNGWQGQTVVQLLDGSRWQQAEYFYEYQYAYRPDVLIDGDVMHVEGISQGVRVRRVS